MPRSGGGIYSAPVGTTAVSGTTIDSAPYNAFIADLVTDANAARPISAGGTGAANAAAARTSLGISATNTPFTPAGNIAATDVQAALAELDAEKAIAADTWTKAEADERYAFAGPVRLFVTPDEYGAIANGVADDAPAVRTAAAAARDFGLPLRFMAGKTYRLASVSGASHEGYAILVDVSGISVELEGTVFAPYSAASNIALYASGTLSAATTLASNATAGATSLTTSAAHGISAGDIVKVGSEATFETDTNTKEGELCRAASGSGTSLTLTTGLNRPYNTADTAGVQKLTPTQVSITGPGRLYGYGRDPSSQYQIGIGIFCAESPVIDGIMVDNFNTKLIWPRDCFGGRFSPRLLKDCVSIGQGYGLAPDGASQDIVVHGIRFENCGHAFTTSNSSTVRGVQRRIVVSDCFDFGSAMRGVGFNVATEAFDTHAGAEDIVFRNCVSFYASGSAFNSECRSVRFENCTAVSPGTDAFAITNKTKFAGSCAVANSKIISPRASGRGVYVFSTGGASRPGFEAVDISGNQFLGLAGAAVHVLGDTLASRRGGVTIMGNVSRRGTSSQQIYVEWLDAPAIQSNILDVDATAGSGIVAYDLFGGLIAVNTIDMEQSSSGDAIYLFATSANSLDRVNVASNVTRGGGATTTGLRINVNAVNCTDASNDFRSCNAERNIPVGVGHRRLSYTAI